MSKKLRASVIEMPVTKSASPQNCQIVSFQALKGKWELLILNERGTAGKKCLGAYLRSCNSTPFKVRFEVAIPEINQSFTKYADFATPSDMCGEREAFEWDEGEAGGQENNFIKFKISIWEEADTVNWKPRSTLGSDWGSFYKQHKSSNVSIVVGSITFLAHILVLQARVPALATLFNGGSKISLKIPMICN